MCVYVWFGWLCCCLSVRVLVYLICCLCARFVCVCVVDVFGVCARMCYVVCLFVCLVS